MRDNWWEFKERHGMMSKDGKFDKEALLDLYGKGYVIMSISYDNVEERDLSIQLAQRYVARFEFTHDEVKIVDNTEHKIINVKVK